IETGLVCFDLTYTFIHVFLIAPSLFLMLGFALRGTHVLPPSFSAIAIALGVAFQILGFVGLFSSTALMLVLVVLVLQNVWTVLAAIVLVVRPAKPAGG